MSNIFFKRVGIRGLTLMEVLIASALASFVAVTVYSTLNYGIKLWQRVQAGLPDEDAAVFFEKFSRELLNTYPYPALKLGGSPGDIAFATMIYAGRTEEGAARAIGRCQYLFDESKGVLGRAQATMSEIYEDSATTFQPVLKNLEACSFSYYFLDKEKEEYQWGPDWPPTEVIAQDANLPLAVKVSIKKRDGGKVYDYEKTVFLPLAGQE